MIRSKSMERIIRLLIALVGVGVGFESASAFFPLLERSNPWMTEQVFIPLFFCTIISVLGGILFFLASNLVIKRSMRFAAAVMRRWEHKLLRLCKDRGGVVLTNDYNLNKVARVTGIEVLNINDLANAVKPMMMAGEELTVQILREGKEPGQGVAYLDDGTMIVVDNGCIYVGQSVMVVVTSVLQTSAGRMIFAKLKNTDVEQRK